MIFLNKVLPGNKTVYFKVRCEQFEAFLPLIILSYNLSVHAMRTGVHFS